jgi:hypothetical protein
VGDTPLLPPHAFMVFTGATLIFLHSIQRRALVSIVSKPSGYTEDAWFLYQLNSFSKQNKTKILVPVISILSIYKSKVLNTTNDFAE